MANNSTNFGELRERFIEWSADDEDIVSLLTNHKIIAFTQTQKLHR
jgi:hypothetical protein